MTSYLLLRDNKETGPFSLTELIDHGFKPYDLVWVEGKSAAWRYPSELKEFKQFSPAIEEQPFDRFFKKPEEQPILELNLSSDQKSQYVAPVTRKSVFVTLPAGRTVQVSKPSTPKYIATPVTTTYQSAEDKVIPDIKYEQPLNDIKEMYVKTLNERKLKIAKKQNGQRYLKIAAAIIGLVIAAVAVAMTIDKKSTQANVLEPLSENHQQLTPAVPVDTSAAVAIEDDIIKPTEDITSQIEEPVLMKVSPPVQKAHHDIESIVKTTATIKQPTASGVVAYQASETNAQGERLAKTRADNVTFVPVSEDLHTKPLPRKPSTVLESKVKVTTNDYQRVAFGGIRNLQLTVTNDSKYSLDNVMVELQYIRPNEMTLKTENILFRSVSANNSATIKIPDTNRGIKVVYKIIHLESKQLNEETLVTAN